MTQLDIFGTVPLETESHLHPVPLPINSNKLSFAPGPLSHTDLITAWSTLPHEIKYGKLKLTFDKEVCLSNRLRNEIKGISHEVKLFESSGGCLCYAISPKKGFVFSNIDHLAHLVSIEPADASSLVEKVRQLANRIHPNAWTDVKAKLLAKPEEYLANYGYTVTNIVSKFPADVIDSIRTAFETKTRYSYDTGGYFSKRKTGRDLRIECKICDDGIFRAWFSSEFPGCANGDYWLLVNPTTAILKERD